MTKQIKDWLKKESVHERPLWKNWAYAGYQFIIEGKIPQHVKYIFCFSFQHPLKSINLLLKVLTGKITSQSMVLHLYGTKILDETLSVCNELNLRPFLAFGTLLGHYRDNGFITHDEDIDLGLLEEDFAKKKQLIESMARKGYHVRVDNNYEIGFEKNNIPGGSIDFFLFYKRDDKIAYSVFFDEANKLCTYNFSPDIFSKFKSVKFMGQIEVLIPEKTKEFLTDSYGNWQTPRQNFNIFTDHKNEDI